MAVIENGKATSVSLVKAIEEARSLDIELYEISEIFN